VFKWAIAGWQKLSIALRSSSRRDYETAEMARLVDGVEQLQRVVSVSSPIIEAPDDRKCPCCGGSRCWAWRDSRHVVGCGGHTEEDKCWRTDEDGVRADGCGGEAEPLPAGATFMQLMERELAAPSRHTIEYVVKHWVPWFWNPLALHIRVKMAPTAWAMRLGRPVQLGRYARVALP
jgi:hypothetical protein